MASEWLFNQKGSRLTNLKREELKQQIFHNGDDIADLEMMRAHFESHPTMPGEKAFKQRVNQILNDLAASESNTWEATEEEKDWLATMYANTEIRDTKFVEQTKIVDVGDNVTPDPETGKPRKYKEPEENTFKLTSVLDAGTYSDIINEESAKDNLFYNKSGQSYTATEYAAKHTYILDAELRKVKDGVNIYAKKSPDAAKFTKIGEVPAKFLTNNPMNVSRCPAQICIEDYSEGGLRNVSNRLVVESSRMSGDAVELNNDMLTDLDKTANLEQ